MKKQRRASTGGQSSDAAVTPDAQLPPLDDQEVKGLREVGRSWAARVPDRDGWQRALPVDPHLKYLLDQPSRRSGFVRIRSRSAASVDEVESTPRGDELDSRLGRASYLGRRVLIGPPLRSTAIAEERMSTLLALPVLSPDALSSVAYGPEAMMSVLVLAGSAELKLSLPIGAVLVVLMLAVGLGYRQVIRAYPHGGGSYIVAKDSLGPRWGLMAAAGLILDYILTVAVSVAAGIAAVTSALPSRGPGHGPARVGRDCHSGLGKPARGQSSRCSLRGSDLHVHRCDRPDRDRGAGRLGVHGFHAVPPPPRHATQALGVLLILRAFSSGATAMTGIEVISNSVQVFEPPEADNARRTLTIMIALLVSMFIGVVLVAHLDGIAPGTQTVLSQIAHRTLGSGVLYAYVQIATTAILLIAANSAINGFPRLLYFMARDRYAPAAFLHMGDRLAFTAGIVVLAVPAAILYAVFNGQTEPLIPLFAVGVFVAFALAQSGMVAHWLNHRERGWRRALAINLVGAVLSGAVALIAAITKFVEGAWLVVVLIPADRARVSPYPPSLPKRPPPASPANRRDAADTTGAPPSPGPSPRWSLAGIRRATTRLPRSSTWLSCPSRCWTRPRLTHSHTRRRCGRPCSRSMSVPARRRASASTAIGRPGGTTCRSR